MGSTRSPEEYAQESRAPRTRAQYRSAWGIWVEWASRTSSHPVLPATPGALCRFAAELAGDGLRPTTISAYLAAIAYAHRASGYPSPCDDPSVRAVLAGIRRTHGVAPRRKSALLLEHLRPAVEGCGTDLAGRRDRALLTLGWAGAMRRDELCALTVDDVEWVEEGMLVTIRRSKTDQEGEGRRLSIPHAQNVESLCPPCRLEEWLSEARITTGPIFRRVFRGGTKIGGNRLSGAAVQIVLERRLAAAGLELAGNWGGHSLRAGLVTQALRGGADIPTVQAMTGHRSPAVLMGYYREVEGFRRNAATEAGL